MNINHGKVSHPVEECKSCPDCIRVKEAFEQAKADGSLDKVLSPNNPFNLSGPLPKGYGITGASSSPTKPCCERCRYDQLDGDVICIFENCECHKVYLVGCLCGRHTTPDITAPGTSHEVLSSSEGSNVTTHFPSTTYSPTKPSGWEERFDSQEWHRKPSCNCENTDECLGGIKSFIRSLLREKAGEAVRVLHVGKLEDAERASHIAAQTTTDKRELFMQGFRYARNRLQENKSKLLEN